VQIRGHSAATTSRHRTHKRRATCSVARRSWVLRGVRRPASRRRARTRGFAPPAFAGFAFVAGAINSTAAASVGREVRLSIARPTARRWLSPSCAEPPKKDWPYGCPPAQPFRDLLAPGFTASDSISIFSRVALRQRLRSGTSRLPTGTMGREQSRGHRRRSELAPAQQRLGGATRMVRAPGTTRRLPLERERPPASSAC
jgi:hypothetical protein